MPKVSDYVADFLAINGIHLAFELSGGMISHLLDSFAAHPDIRVISMHHEQSASFAAEAVGRLTGRPAVALGTSGPGALNLVSGIASCYYDSVPALFITGDVQTYMEAGQKPLRQFGLQECPFPAVAAPIAKSAVSVKRAADVPAAFEQALLTAVSGRPGPVVIELPFDVQGQPLNAQAAAVALPPPQPPADDAVTVANEILASAQRPLILAGGGVRSPAASDALRRFAEKTGVPLATSIAALDVVPAGHPLRVGLVGMYGTRAGNLVMAESDAILVVGSRLDAGLIGADTSAWERHKTIVRVDCDAGELSARLRNAKQFHADAGAFLAAALASAPNGVHAEWRARVQQLKSEHPDTAEHATGADINPNLFMHQLSAGSGDAVAYVVDAGQHTWWSAQSLQLTGSQRYLGATGLWAMGSSLPAAIGVALHTGRPVVAIAGDAGIQLNLQELHALIRYQLPVKIVVINNHCHGMVRQFQDEFFDRRRPSTVWGYSPPDFTAVAAAYGIRSAAVDRQDDVPAAVARMWADPAAPFLLNATIPLDINVSPYVPLGRPLSGMVPPRP
ncbi:MAG TPA: thiamine pyrophosphate-binding protein [Thermoanaerobaculia bacterium]|nr:thiamine pyrophosphate-binding protein [Thermoanaerobaculia bacterium]